MGFKWQEEHSGLWALSFTEKNRRKSFLIKAVWWFNLIFFFFTKGYLKSHCGAQFEVMLFARQSFALP